MKNIKTIHNINLKSYNTLRLDTTAQIAYFPKNTDELILLIKKIEKPIIIGGGSNIIFSSKGIKNPIIFLKDLNGIKIENDILCVNSGVKSQKFAHFCLNNSITSFEFLIGIPSSIGGNIVMNAGACGQEISENLISCDVIDTDDKTIKNIKKEDMNFKYRSSIFKENPKYVILNAYFKITYGNKDEIKNRMNENLLKRKKTQPGLILGNAGSTFKNPEGQSAGKLLDECNLKGKTIGGAKVYENHANFIVNYNNATSTDILSLMAYMQDCVYNKFNIKLESEIIFIGEKNKKEEELWKKLTTKK